MLHQLKEVQARTIKKEVQKPTRATLSYEAQMKQNMAEHMAALKEEMNHKDTQLSQSNAQLQQALEREDKYTQEIVQANAQIMKKQRELEEGQLKEKLQWAKIKKYQKTLDSQLEIQVQAIQLQDLESDNKEKGLSILKAPQF